VKKVPLGAEIMVQAGDAEVIIPNEWHVSSESQDVQMVAAAEASAGCDVGLRHELPQSHHGRADSQTQGVACAGRIGGGHSASRRHRPVGGVKVVLCGNADNGTIRVKTMRSNRVGSCTSRAQLEDALPH